MGGQNDGDCAADSVDAMECFYCAIAFCQSRAKNVVVRCQAIYQTKVVLRCGAR